MVEEEAEEECAVRGAVEKANEIPPVPIIYEGDDAVEDNDEKMEKTQRREELSLQGEKEGIAKRVRHEAERITQEELRLH